MAAITETQKRFTYFSYDDTEINFWEIIIVIEWL